ncbi:hypothetical protein RHS01_08789 [Rhizoctonia solani]|uniref:Uncharacterized protein n=1 Tax=Rhizoctonia solani TaxID=456999 RepID=A0A8H7M439_9AGAM|nr:hypothetical protein RHS01_08789 [Rhizoctonia solani]
MHPLHCLALAVNESISKLHAIGLLDNLSAQDEYKETEIKFKRAETQMKRLRLDFKRAPNFEVPLLNEDAKVKDNGANSNTKNADNNCAGNKAGPNGDCPGHGHMTSTSGCMLAKPNLGVAGVIMGCQQRNNRALWLSGQAGSIPASSIFLCL